MVKKIKIVFRLRSLEMGGVNKVLIDILNHLPKEKLDLTILVNLFQGELRNEIPKNIKLIKIAKGKEDFSKNLLIQKLQLIFRALKLKLLHHFSFLMKYYYKENYDIEIAFGRAELEMVLKSPQKNSKKIAWVHWEFSHEPELNQSDLLIERLKQFDHVVFCSDNVRRQVKELYGFEFPSSSVIPNVIHPQEILDKSIEKRDDLPKFNDDLFTFVSVGRVKNGKGYPLLLEIHKNLINQGFFHRIIIVGDGDKLVELKEKAKELGINNTFVLIGNKNNPFPYIVNSDCFILPTQSEAYPLSIKEALLLGIPVLATDVGGMSEILTDGIDGLLMKYDKKDIEEKMKFLLNNSILFSQLKSGAAQAKNKFEIEAVYQKIEKLLTN
ncbi:MAG: glycosyltransferase [Weeksellaceae bacterium]|jgi:glycosyltransferase involved in cell wall biosynthesis|nr:glycosyltransferase [Weeksellaceae bacterium]